MVTKNKRLGYWIALSVTLHLALLFIPLSGSLSLPVRVVDVRIVSTEEGREVARGDPGNTPARRQPVPVRKEATRTATDPVEEIAVSETTSPRRSADVDAVTAFTAAPDMPSAGSVGSSRVMASLGRETDKRSGLPGEGTIGAAGGPSFIKQVKPVYPLVAKKLGKEGRVILRLTIDENGTLADVEVVEGAGFGFTESAIEAVKKSVFAPALVNGRPVASRALLPVRFTLKAD